MIVTYTFDTNSETYDVAEHKLVERAQDMALALWDIKQYLRSIWKYQEEPADINVIYERFNDILLDYGLTDEIIG